MRLVGELRSCINIHGCDTVTISLFGKFAEQFEKLKDKNVDVEITEHKEKRSMSANALCWELCTVIGKALTPPIPKEEVYRRAIKDVGVYEPLPIKAEAVDHFIKAWSEHGTGWIAEVIDNSKLPGYKLVFAYYGSSTYNTKEMSTLIDYLIDEAQQMGLEIAEELTEVDRAIEEWRKQHE